LAVLRELFEVQESDFLDHPSFREAGYIDPIAFPEYERHALVTALAEQGAIFSAGMMTWLRPLSIISTDIFDLTFLWGEHPEYELRILASRVFYCGRKKELTFFLAPFTRSRLQTASTFRVGSPELDALRSAVYQELVRLGCPLGNDLQVPDEHAAPPTLHEAIAALQPATPSCLFASLASSPAALAVKSAQAVLEYDVTPHGSASNAELLAKLQHLAQDNLNDKIVQASVAMFPLKETSVFYSQAQALSYNNNMSACQALQTLIASPHLDKEAMLKELQRLQGQLAQQAATILLTAEHGFVAGNKFTQEVAAANDVTYLSAYTSQVEKAIAAQKSANAEAAAQAAKRQRTVRPRGGHQAFNAAWGAPMTEPAAGQGQAASAGGSRRRGRGRGATMDQGGGVATPPGTSVRCFNCGDPGHKSPACPLRSTDNGANVHSASSDRWILTTEEPATTQNALEWRPGWSAESVPNARQAGTNSGSGKGKAGGKGKGFGRGGYGRGGGYASSSKGGGKSDGWSTGSRSASPTGYGGWS